MTNLVTESSEASRVRYLAHSANDTRAVHLLCDHLMSVATLAKKFLGGSPSAEEAALAGILHDLGKYGDLFQARLRGEESGLDHWSAGARVAIENRCAAAALAIQGHHIGLQSLNLNALRRLPEPTIPRLRLTTPDTEVLKTRLANDGIQLPEVTQSLLGSNLEASTPSMLDVRMLFSALVDADYLDTEAHFNGDRCGKRYRQPGQCLDANSALQTVMNRITSIQSNTTASHSVAAVRRTLLDACLAAAQNSLGLFTLTAPTGSGKTLAMLAFALAHAAKHGLDRIIVVIPYLTITEQTACIYRSIFTKDPRFGEHFVLEHHSLAGVGEEHFKGDNEGEVGDVSNAERRRRLLAENWDAPIIVTTSVQMLESMFSNRPAACRKLHRLQRAVILFDEAQTLPTHLAVPTLAALSHLSATYCTSVLFATATQPAFAHLDEEVRKAKTPGWQPREIVPNPAALFAPMKRVEVDWGSPDMPATWDELAEKILRTSQTLSIVNLKRHAQALWDKLGDPATLHLSTNLCPAHRQDVLEAVRTRLKAGEPVRLVATQCVEAGVDIDFPVVFRAWGPLDAIIQAAGRCNREGIRPNPGQLHVFQPEEDKYPPGGYEQAAQVAKMLYRRHGKAGMSLDDPAFITAYYRELYDLAGIARSTATEEILKAVRDGTFPDIARLYCLIRQDAINVLVPYAGEKALFDVLRDTAEHSGLTAAWIRNARPLTVSLYRPKNDDPVWDSLLPVPVAGWRQREQNDWFIYALPEHYHPQLGLVPPGALNTWIA